jgi:hypothetical protein
MNRRTWWLTAAALILVPPTLLLGFWYLFVGHHQFRMQEAADEMTAAIKKHFPHVIQIDGTYAGGDSPSISVVVYGVVTQEERAAMRDWVAAWKAERQLKVRIWLGFPNQFGVEPQQFEL